MSNQLPIFSSEDVVKSDFTESYKVVRQRGGHLRLKDLTNPSHKPITVPFHKELKPGLLRKIINDADLSVEEFKKLLGK
jgi:predicted RNA binding protein YcfA (HicA-like mRNA interferase family)